MDGLALEGVTVRFGRHVALDRVDLEVPAGGIVALLGPSGAGKTTLLRVAAGLERPAAGRVRLGGREVTGRPAGARDVAMQFEHYALYPQRTVFENIAFPLRAPVRRAEWPESRVAEAVGRVARLLSIDPLLDRLPRQLSGGQRQRVALARALVRRPAAMLLDEPIAHLDAKLRHLLRASLKHHLRAEGVTAVWATPDQLEAIAVGDRIALIEAGRIVSCGTPAALYRRPATLAVARALGEPPINLIDGELRREASRLAVAWGAAPGSGPPSSGPRGERLVWPLPPSLAARVEAGLATRSAAGGAVRLGVRPAAVCLGGPGAGGDALPGRVELVEPLGGSAVVTLAVGDARLKAKRPGTERWPAGQAVPVTFDPDGVHVFDPTSGEALA